ncbi:MAG: hypothetical protein LAT57_06925 [Balneolales bacterium]|nr:hypothetical protein [Balneolales bacterium]
MFRLPAKLISTFAVAVVLIAGCSSDHDHADIAGFTVMVGNETVVSQSGTTITGQFNVQSGVTTPEMTVNFTDPDGHTVSLDDPDYRLEVASSNTDVLTTNLTGDMTFTLQGVSTGSANVNINVLHGSHYDFESRPISVSVVAAQ